MRVRLYRSVSQYDLLFQILILYDIGYVPIEFNGIRQERKTSCDPRTSNGAAYGGGKAML